MPAVCNAFAWKKFSSSFQGLSVLTIVRLLLFSPASLCCAALHLCVCACVCVCLSNSSCSFRINSLVLNSSWREKQGKMLSVSSLWMCTVCSVTVLSISESATNNSFCAKKCRRRSRKHLNRQQKQQLHRQLVRLLIAIVIQFWAMDTVRCPLDRNFRSFWCMCHGMLAFNAR